MCVVCNLRSFYLDYVNSVFQSVHTMIQCTTIQFTVKVRTNLLSFIQLGDAEVLYGLQSSMQTKDSQEMH